MKRVNGLVIAVAMLVISNAMALRHAAVNRMGEPESEIELTERELQYRKVGDSSAVFLHLVYSEPVEPTMAPGAYPASRRWITEQELRAGGIEVGNSYGPRRVIVAFEYEGPGWEARQEAMDRYRPPGGGKFTAYPVSRLVPVGIGRDVAAMRARFPDRHKVILLPAVVRLGVTDKGVAGFLSDVPSMIHVPLPFAKLPFYQFQDRREPLYKVRVRFGTNLEPWITGVEFLR
jgi:hypothetical protein